MSMEEYAAWGTLKLLQVAVLLRMARSGLLKPYRFFAAYLGCAILSSVILVSVGRQAYTPTWRWISYALLLVLVLAVIEVHLKIQEHFPPVKFRNAMSLLLVALSALLCYATMEASDWFSSIKPAMWTSRAVLGTLAWWLVLQITFLPALQPPLTPVLFRHALILSAMTCVQLGVLIALNILAPNAPRKLLSLTYLLGQSVCCVLWLFAFRREADRPAVPQPGP